MSDLEITGDSIRLREFVPSDVDPMSRYTSDPEVCRYISWGPLNREGTSKFVSSAIEASRCNPRRWYELAIVSKDTDELVGNIGLELDRGQDRVGELGYTVRPDFWGQGIATAASRLLLDYAFERVRLHRVWANCDEENRASARVLEKLGLSLEGRHRDVLFVRGSWRTTLTYALLDEDRVADTATRYPRPD